LDMLEKAEMLGKRTQHKRTIFSSLRASPESVPSTLLLRSPVCGFRADSRGKPESRIAHAAQSTVLAMLADPLRS